METDKARIIACTEITAGHPLSGQTNFVITQAKPLPAKTPIEAPKIPPEKVRTIASIKN